MSDTPPSKLVNLICFLTLSCNHRQLVTLSLTGYTATINCNILSGFCSHYLTEYTSDVKRIKYAPTILTTQETLFELNGAELI